MADSNGDASKLAGYAEKFKDLIQLCDERAKGDTLLIATLYNERMIDAACPLKALEANA